MQKLNHKQVHLHVKDCQNLPHDTCVRVTMAARPLLMLVA
jgi:hypothetical protein